MDSEMSVRHKVDLERMLLDGSAEPMRLSLSLLEDITNGFSDDQQIGSGGSAVVYKGIVGIGVVAVKKLSKTFGVHENKYYKEVECLMKAKHKNIVRFLGYCSDTQRRAANYKGKFVMAEQRSWLLCFEYVPNGSLDEYITDVSCGLEWGARYQIIKGVCEGLLHLHEKRILHLDLKPSNILIDDHMVPKIADFGISRCLDKDQTRAFTSNLCGSQGYLPPEFYSGQVAFASDVYSLGVIIVEILTGGKRYPEDANVVDNWMNRLEASDQWETQLEQVRVCTKIGMECMDMDPKKRPVARYIVDRLDKAASTAETGITSSSVEKQVSYPKEAHGKGKIAKLSSEYFGKDIKERVETEELVEYVETTREDHWQQGHQEAPDDQNKQAARTLNIRTPGKLVSYEPGICARRLAYYMYHLQNRPQNNNIEYWRKFVDEYFAPTAKKRLCVSLCGTGSQNTEAFPQNVWHCEICCKPGQSFETTFEALPQAYQTKYASGTLEEPLYVDMPREFQNVSGQIVLDYTKAIQESVFEQLHVVREGHLRIIYSSDLKIISWEFCARRHKELVPRRSI